jgi:hypothetical protein
MIGKAQAQEGAASAVKQFRHAQVGACGDVCDEGSLTLAGALLRCRRRGTITDQPVVSALRRTHLFLPISDAEEGGFILRSTEHLR